MRIQCPLDRGTGGLEFLACAPAAQIRRDQSLDISLGERLVSRMNGRISLLRGSLPAGSRLTSLRALLQLLDSLVEPDMTQIIKRCRLQPFILAGDCAFQQRFSLAQLAGLHVFGSGIKSLARS